MNPQAVIWIISGKCNLRCVHCYASRFLSSAELTVEEKLKLIKELAESGVAHVGITGGEPFLDKNIRRYIKEIREYGMTCDVNTNATIMTQDLANFLRKYDVFLYVSIDGATKRTHERIRGIGTWDKLMKNLQMIREGEVEFSTVFAISKLNYFEAGEYVKLAESLGAFSACMIPLMPVGRAGKDIIPSREELAKALKAAESTADEIDYWMSVWCFRAAKLIIDPRYVSAWADCRRGKILDIDPAGNLMLCDVLDITAGNVRSGFRKALEEYSMHDSVRRVTSPELKEPCASCPLKNDCMGGCYARSYMFYRTLDGPDPYCPKTAVVKEEIQETM